MSDLVLLLSACAAAGAVLLWPPVRRRRRHRPAPLPLPGHTWGLGSAGLGRVGRVPPRAEVPVAVVIELVAAALACGLPPGDAVGAAVRAAGPAAAADLQGVVDALRLGTSPELAWQRAAPAYAPLARTLLLAERTGAGAAPALRRAALDERAARRRRAQIAARRLGVQLVLPLGLATLPSFVLLGVVPVVLGLAAQVLTLTP